MYEQKLSKITINVNICCACKALDSLPGSSLRSEYGDHCSRITAFTSFTALPVYTVEPPIGRLPWYPAELTAYEEVSTFRRLKFSTQDTLSNTSCMCMKVEKIVVISLLLVHDCSTSKNASDVIVWHLKVSHGLWRQQILGHIGHMILRASSLQLYLKWESASDYERCPIKGG